MVSTTRSKARAPSAQPSTSEDRHRTRSTASPPLPSQTVLNREETLSVMYHLLSRLSAQTSTICPSQIARRLHELQPDDYPDWRLLMDPVRDVVWEEVASGKVEVTQGGVARSIEERAGLKGPIRVRRAVNFQANED